MNSHFSAEEFRLLWDIGRKLLLEPVIAVTSCVPWSHPAFQTTGFPINFGVSLSATAINARIKGVSSRDQTPWSSNCYGHEQKGLSPTPNTTIDGHGWVSGGEQWERSSSRGEV